MFLFLFWSSQKQFNVHARIKKTLFVNVHLFLTDLLNDSQMILSTIHFPKHLL